MPIDQEEQQQVCNEGNSSNAEENESKITNGDHNHEVHKSLDGRNKKELEDENKDPSAIKQGGDLESTKAEMGEVMEENQRLKQYLDQIMKDYQALQMRYYEFSQQDQSKKPKDIVNITTPHAMKDDDDDETELFSLSLGRSSSLDSKKSITNNNNNKLNNINTNSSSSKEKDEAAAAASNVDDDQEVKDQQSLTLGLDCKFEASRQTSSTNNSCDENNYKDKEVGGKLEASWPTNVIPNNNNNNNNNTKSGIGEDEVVQQPPVKKARVSVRARCDTPTMNDGCQWRKYGQKIAKGNPCPRAYYRCTVAPSCPVRKQVQRCAEDMSILITTYEGAHNHPLPISATAMASTTSAAAYMLMSGSSTSSQGSHDLTTTPTPIPATRADHHNRNGINFNILDNSQPRPFYLPNSSSSATFSPTPSHPTITLDLTSTTTTTTNFNRVTPNFLPRYSSTNLTFNATNTSNNTTLPISWPNGSVNYGSQSYNKGQGSPIDNNNTINLHSLMTKTNLNNLPNQQPLPDTIAQAAKVLTSDPNFQSVLTAALSSFISSNSNNVSGGNNSLRLSGVESKSTNISDDFAQKLKWGGVQTSATSVNSSLPSTNKSTNGCGSSMLTIDSSTTNSLPAAAASLVFLSPPLPFSGSKSASTSPGDTRDHTS